MIENIEVLTLLRTRVQAAINRSITRPFLTEAGKRSVKLIRTRTRLGGAIPSGRLKKLSKSYVLQRKGNALFFTKNGKVLAIKKTKKNTGLFNNYKPNLFALTTAGRSNLTATGSMLNSMRSKVVTTKSINIYLKNSPRKTLFGEADSTTNSKIANYVAEGGRKFLGLRKSEKNNMQRFFRERVLNALKFD